MKLHVTTFLFIFILNQLAFAFEPLNTDLLIIKNTTPLLRLGAAARGMINMPENENTDPFEGYFGFFADLNIYSKRKNFHRGIDLYVRSGYRRFRSDPDPDNNIFWHSNINILSAAPGIRFVYGFGFLKSLIQLYFSAHPEMVFVWERTDENDNTTKYLSTGIVGTVGVEITSSPLGGFFIEYNNGYAPIGKEETNIEGHQVYFGVTYRRR